MPSPHANETALLDAIIYKKTTDVSAILKTEIQSLRVGEPATIRPKAATPSGETACHLAARTGVKLIINAVVHSDINFVYHLPNSKNELPEAYCWSGRFKTELAKRIQWEEEEAEDSKLKRAHDAIVRGMQYKEAESGCYKAGIIFTSNFTLCYSSTKNPIEKNCLIEDKSEYNGQSIHDRQALDEAVYANQSYVGKNEWLDIPSRITENNYLLVDIGFVIGMQSYEKGSTIKRKFISLPVDLSVEGLAREGLYRTRGGRSKHSEVNAYEIIMNRVVLITLLRTFRQHLSLLEHETRKLYAAVIDIHSSQDVCDGCETESFRFQRELPGILSELVSDANFMMSKHFKTVIRASASRQPSHSGYRKQLHLRDLNENNHAIARETTHEQALDVKKSELFMLHSDRNYRKKHGEAWYKRTRIFKATFKNLPKRTLFFSGNLPTPWETPEFPTRYKIRSVEEFPRLK